MAILDQGPPPPPGVAAPPAPSLPAMAGPAGQGASGGDPSLAKAVLEKMMIVEKTLQDAATIMPALAPVVGDLIQQFRARVGAIVLQSQGETQQPAGGMSALLGGGASAPATS